MIIRLAKTKLADQSISWREAYTDRTIFLKEQFEEVVGKGSYFRFEGKNNETGDEYYCIVGPAKIKAPRAKFFAGVRKLPATYPAGGKYFDGLTEAMQYAHDTWGISIPKTLKSYNSSNLVGIKKKVDAWKAARKEEDEDEDATESDDDGVFIEKRVYKANRGFNFFKSAMGTPKQVNRNAYTWWDLDTILSGFEGNPDAQQQWEDAISSEPTLENTVRDAMAIRTNKLNRTIKQYGLTRDQVAVMSKFYIGYYPSAGAYICSIGPHVNELKKEADKRVWESAKDKFCFYRIRRRRATEEAIKESLDGAINAFSNKFDIQFEPRDFEFVVKSHPENDPNAVKQKNKIVQEVVPSLDPNDPVAQEFYRRAPILSLGSDVAVNNRGRMKVLEKYGPVLDRAIVSYAEKTGLDQDEIRHNLYSDPNLLKKFYKMFKNKYAEMVSTGEAALVGMEPPPKDLSTAFQRKSGQQGFTTVARGDGIVDQLVIRKLSFVKEIAELLASGIRGDDLVSSINSVGGRSKAPISDDVINLTVSKIDESIANGEYTDYNDAALKINDDIIEYSNSFGFKDLKTAFDMAKLYFKETSVDPVTKSKLGEEFVAENVVINIPEDFPNVHTDALRRIRENHEARTAEEAEAEDTEEDVVTEIGEGEVDPSLAVNEEAEAEIQDETEISSFEREEVTTTTTTLPQPMPEATQEVEEFEDSDFDLFASTVNNLIKLAEDLDNELCDEDAEEIHKIIRKYQSK